MNNKIIAINIGSRSKKYGFFDGLEEIARAEYATDEINSFETFLKKFDPNLQTNKILMRVVATGKIFSSHQIIDDEYLTTLEESSGLNPTHPKLVLAEISEIRKLLPNTTIYAISDSAFHRTLPHHAKIYALPEAISLKYGIERQGYHGLAITQALEALKEHLGHLPNRVISCHLGGGSSVTAIRDGKPVDTSMGWTTLEGLPMTDRVGDIDPGIIAFLSKALNKSGEALERFLATECGLEAISGIKDGNIPDILNSAAAGDIRATRALEFYIFRIRKYIGAMAAVLGGVDVLLFSGTVSEKSALIRSLVTQNLNYLGLEIDPDKNIHSGEVSKPTLIGKNNLKNQIAVVPIDEMVQMIKEYLATFS